MWVERRAQEDAKNEPDHRPDALALLNKSLAREGFEAFYAQDNRCYLRHIATKSTAPLIQANPHRPFSPAELESANVYASTSILLRKTS
jgi:hypothetical protein